MRDILRKVKSVSASMLTVLVPGESGTGKELIAQAIHKHSARAAKRFVALNCAAEAENLLEDQLFGHVRGAFTGAEKEREGVFEYASGGTLFLDEIGDMPLAMQSKLLRVLQTGEVVRLGSNEPRKVDVRLVSATNKDLKGMIERKEFRSDLYYRINGSEVKLPPLRERREDIPRVVRHAIVRAAENLAKAQGRPAGQATIPDITEPALRRLTQYSWPGNVRQLLNVVENMVVMASGEPVAPGQPIKLDVRHIPDDVRLNDDDPGEGVGAGAAGSLAGSTLEQLEKRAIRETLRLTGGNREQAAQMLGLGERTLYRKLKDYGLR
jgi:two-component system response regulator HydG